MIPSSADSKIVAFRDWLVPLAQTELYKVLSHDGARQVYRYEVTGFVYTSRRVDEKFELPSCETIS